MKSSNNYNNNNKIELDNSKKKIKGDKNYKIKKI